MRTALLAAALAAALAACGRASAPEGGRVTATWRSDDTTRTDVEGWTSAASARWCERDGRLALLAVSGDTGIGVAVRTTALAPGRFAVADSAGGLPAAKLALRLLGDVSVEGFAARDGEVTLTEAGRTVSGRFGGTLRLAGATEEGAALRLDGAFERVPVVAGDSACGGPAGAGQTPGGGVP